MNTSVLHIPRGLADLERNVAYVVNGQGLIECLNLSNGQVEARTLFSASPLLLNQDEVIGWRADSDSSHSLIIFSASQEGNVLRTNWETSIPLPDWVETDSVDPTRFAITGSLEDGQITVTWEAHSRYSGGAPPSQEVELAHSYDERRTVLLNSETGVQIASEQSSPVLASPDPGLPDLPASQHHAPYRIDSVWSTHPWYLDSTELFLVRTTTTPGLFLIRREQNSPESATEIPLSSDPMATAVVTLGGQFILVRESGEENQSWLVYSAVTGEQLTSIPLGSDIESAELVGDRIIYLVAEDERGKRRRYLRAWDLTRSELIWSHLLSEQTLSQPPPLPQ